ncbi:MAG: AAA family ATPase [Planctomycetota bacterium]|jgi:Mrp family chromosome partitioning ATPase|nr:AAA family ATPase [Planctomycetota bacterium]
MNADQAFDNLLNRNAIAIPQAAPAGDTLHRSSGEKRKGAKTGVDISDDKLAMQVSSLLDDDASDYNPSPGYGHAAVHEYPTEIDLPIAAENASGGGGEDALKAAWREGALIVGRDADGGGVPGFSASVDEGATSGKEPEANAGNDAELALARRVRRFACLPVAGMDRFEVDARKLMANLSIRHPERPSLAITGAARGGGRTELSIRLAFAMAKKIEHRILLVDGDMGKPDIAARLGVSVRRFVLSDVIGGSCRIGEALTASDDNNLYVLPARAPERDGEEIPDLEKAEKFFGQLHRLFDFIIIDCGPLDRSDAVLFSRLAGSTALAGRSGRSRAADLRNVAADLRALGVDLAGLILVGT